MGLLPLMRLLLEAKAEIHTTDDHVRTAFHYTCANNRPDCAEALVRAGCDTSLRDNNGRTGRDVAEEAGHTAVLERLDALDSEKYAFSGDYARALVAAALSGDCGAMERLIDGGLDVNALATTGQKCPRTGQPSCTTALHAAVAVT